LPMLKQRYSERGEGDAKIPASSKISVVGNEKRSRFFVSLSTFLLTRQHLLDQEPAPSGLLDQEAAPDGLGSLLDPKAAPVLIPGMHLSGGIAIGLGSLWPLTGCSRLHFPTALCLSQQHPVHFFGPVHRPLNPDARVCHWGGKRPQSFCPLESSKPEGSTFPRGRICRTSA
jgi:hypothetical protein